MCAAPNVPYDDILDDAPILRPTTPLPGANRALRRTISSASIDTIRPRDKNKGIRQRIEEIVKKIDAKKKIGDASSQDVSKSTGGGRLLIKRSRSTKEWKCREWITGPLRNAALGPEDGADSPLLDRLYSGVPSERDTPSTVLACNPNLVADVPLPDGEEEHWETLSHPAITVFRGRGTSQAEVKDLKFNIKSLESDVTIWDGLQAPHHVYKSRLFLQCAQPYDSVSMPDIRLLEMECSTRPILGSRYAHQPVLQSTYQGATPEWLKTPNGIPRVNIADGIHVDCFWRTILEEDGSWGWYRDVYIPLSSRLFDKMDYREFKLVGRVWIENDCLEGESTFGISMLLRGVDME